MIVRSTFPLPSSLRAHSALRPLSTSARHLNLRSSLTHPPRTSTSSSSSNAAPAPPTIPDKLLGTREQLEARRREFEDKYGEKLRRKMQEDKASSLADLKSRARIASRQKADAEAEGAASAQAADGASARAQQKRESLAVNQEAAAVLARTKASRAEAIAKAKAAREGQGSADRAGVKPLSSILNLDLIFSPPTTPATGAAASEGSSPAPRTHTTSEISLLWQAYHSTHPTLAPTFLSASIPPRIYSAMARAGQACPRFVVPLPREPAGGPAAAAGQDAGFEMFYLQWLFHPTRGVPREWWLDPEDGAHPALPISSVLFTPLAEFRSSGEWAQPHLVLTHYPDLHNVPPAGVSSSTHQPSHPHEQHHPVVLMRGEILSHPSSSPLSSPLPTSHLSLTQAQAQLLAMAVQRFYAAAISPEEATEGKKGENDIQRAEREERGAMLGAFARGDPAFDIAKLVKMAYAGVA